jgi:hypothetical protein
LIDEHRMPNRSSVVMAIVTISALGLSAAAMIGAFVVVDERAAQFVRSEPRIAPAAKKAAAPVGSSRTAAGSDGTPASSPRPPAQTVGSAAASARAGGPQTASRQARTGELAPDTRSKRRTEARHGGRRHSRDLARSSPEQPGGGAASGIAQGTQVGGQAAVFFPFR